MLKLAKRPKGYEATALCCDATREIVNALRRHFLLRYVSLGTGIISNW